MAILERGNEDAEARAAETAKAHRSTIDAEQANLTGVYVYTLPHNLRYPYDPETGPTLLKVGQQRERSTAFSSLPITHAATPGQTEPSGS